jgi:hypothetical protein
LTFQRIEPSREYGALRLLSETGRWELGLTTYQSGIRLRMGPAGRPPSVIDFCLGHNPDIVSPVLLAVIRILESVPESGTPKEIDAVFPWAGLRPDLNSHLASLLASSSGVKRSSQTSSEKVPRQATPLFDQYPL